MDTSVQPKTGFSIWYRNQGSILVWVSKPKLLSETEIFFSKILKFLSCFPISWDDLEIFTIQQQIWFQGPFDLDFSPEICLVSLSVMVSPRKYRPIWVWVLVSDLKLNSGFNHTLNWTLTLLLDKNSIYYSQSISQIGVESIVFVL